MSIFDPKRPRPAEPLSTLPASGVEEKELTSGIVDRRKIDGVSERPASSSPAQSGARARPPLGSAPLLEIGDPVTYDPTIEDSYDGTLPGDSHRGRDSVLDPPSCDVAPSAHIPASLDWSDPASKPSIVDDETAEEEEEQDAYIGTTISDRYVLDQVIGEGGMGRVYRAHHKIIGKSVAIKILHAELARDKAAVGRFVREAQAASSVGNAHIVDIADFGETSDGSTYFVMEYLDGATLTELIEENGSLGADLVYDLTLQLTDGLQAAHLQQIVHRDLKPDNITIIEHGKVERFCKILDFGIAKVNTSASSTKLTMAGAVFGTPHYMSPEQAAGAAVDHRTDIYSLGVIMYEMISGQLPFNADNFMGILTQHMYKAPVAIRAIVGAPDCPPGLEAVILKCLSKKPDARYQTMDELAADIRRLQTGEVPVAIHDMMARSGGFNVPADYFQSGSRAAPSMPSGKKKKLKPSHIATVAGVAMAMGLVTFVLLENNKSDALPRTSTAPTVEAPKTEPAAPVTVDVMLASNAPAATALVGDASYPLPKLLTLTKGEALSVRIVARGFADQVVEIDGTQKEVKVTQRAVARPRPTPPIADKPAPSAAPPPVRPIVRPPTPKPGPKSVDGVVDPWAK